MALARKGFGALAPLCLLLAPALAAQSLGLDPARDEPRWLRAWSPLEERGNLIRRLPAAGAAFLEDSALAGQFWTAGNPGGLAREVGPGRTDFSLAWSRQDGDYRRPFDPVAARLIGLRVRSWHEISPGFALIGSIAADQERLDPGGLADETEPYPTSPFTTIDTSAAPLRRTRVRLEGAGSWQVGAWGLGLSLGLETRDHQTIESAFVRRLRSAMPGAVFGVSRRLGGMEAGLYGRYRYRSETIRLIEAAAEGRVYHIEGYAEPRRIDLLSTYYRQIHESATSAGASLRAGLAGGTLAAWAEARWLSEGLSVVEQNDPPEDTWRTSGGAAGLDWQRPLGASWRVEVHALAEALRGDGDRYLDSAAVIFTAEERRVAGGGNLRFDDGSWSGAIGGGFRYESRRRVDSAAGTGTDISAPSPVVQGMLGHRFGAVRVLVSGSLLIYVPTSQIPAPDSRGAGYRRFLAPEVDLYALSANPSGFAARVEWQVKGKTMIWLVGRTESVSPTNGPLTAYSPSGTRSVTAIEIGVTM